MGWLGRTSYGLDFGFQTIVVANPQYFTVISHTQQDHSAGGVGKGAYFTSKPTRAGALELSRESFAEGDEVGESVLIHPAVP